MTDMIERVAAAMWERTHDGRWDDWGDGQDESRIIHRDDARAAIAAMREPTETACRLLWSPGIESVVARLRFHADRMEEEGHLNAARWMRIAAGDIEILREDARTIDRDELVALLENLASVNLSGEACERQAQRMADGLIAALDRDWGKSND